MKLVVMHPFKVGGKNRSLSYFYAIESVNFDQKQIRLLPYFFVILHKKIYIIIKCTSFSFNLTLRYELVIIYSTHRSYYSTVIIVSIYNQLNVM